MADNGWWMTENEWWMANDGQWMANDRQWRRTMDDKWQTTRWAPWLPSPSHFSHEMQVPCWLMMDSVFLFFLSFFLFSIFQNIMLLCSFFTFTLVSYLVGFLSANPHETHTHTQGDRFQRVRVRGQPKMTPGLPCSSLQHFACEIGIQISQKVVCCGLWLMSCCRVQIWKLCIMAPMLSVEWWRSHWHTFKVQVLNVGCSTLGVNVQSRFNSSRFHCDTEGQHHTLQ